MKDDPQNNLARLDYASAAALRHRWDFAAAIAFCLVHGLIQFGLYAGRMHNLGICNSDVIVFLAPSLAALFVHMAILHGRGFVAAFVTGAALALLGMFIEVVIGLNIYGS